MSVPSRARPWSSPCSPTTAHLASGSQVTATPSPTSLCWPRASRSRRPSSPSRRAESRRTPPRLMGYQLGIDLGTTYTAAAVARDARVEMVTLGNRAPSVPTVIYLRQDDSVLTGDAANRRALSEPDRVAREFKRRVGDPNPIFLGGSPWSAESLVAKFLRWVVDSVAAQEGEAPDAIAISHPAN